MSRAPSTKSRTPPAAMRRGPDSPAATTPPSVAPRTAEAIAREMASSSEGRIDDGGGAKWGGSNGSIWRCRASSASTSRSGVPARATMTSSLGS